MKNYSNMETGGYVNEGEFSIFHAAEIYFYRKSKQKAAWIEEKETLLLHRIEGGIN